MKQILAIILAMVSLSTFPQDSRSKDGKGFNSIFQKLKEGKKKGVVTGVLKVKYCDGEVISEVFSESSATLQIKPDANEIYDVSHKTYLTKNDNMKVEYTTYNYANSIKIYTDKEPYHLSLIDGACLGVINGINYQYVQTEDKELLILHFSKDIGLSPGKCFTSAECYILKGSILIFCISK
ncbi:hypothetical protein EYV94_26755 [Puteibacter caeruleilacunae]|nr:hypothetical protein EYV94_26755 [Puteibacter caeruleilacunae]